MKKHKVISILRTVSLFLLLCFFTPSPSSADTEILNKKGWVVNGAIDTGSDPRDIAVSVDGTFVGNFSELKIFHGIKGLGFPQIFSVKGRNGALRPVLPPPGEFGGTCYGTGYWDCEAGFVQNLQILELNIRTKGSQLRFLGKVSNLSSFDATDFTLRLFRPTRNSVKAQVAYTLIATRNFCVDQTRQAAREGFRIARIASNFISTDVHDSDQARYVNTDKTIVCAGLQNQDGFIFADPLPMRKKDAVSLIHTDTVPRNTPTLSIKFDKPRPQQVTPQGFVAFSADPNDDNVDFWTNWDLAKSSYTTGETIGRFVYTLEAVPPGPKRCE